MWYERLTKCYLLHTDLLEFRELGKTCQATYFPLSILNHWSFTEHTSWPSKPRLPKFPPWDSWAWIMNQKWDVVPMSSNYGPWWDYIVMSFGPWDSASFLWIWTLLDFKIDSPKIHDSVDVVQVANEMKSCGMKNLSSTPFSWSSWPPRHPEGGACFGGKIRLAPSSCLCSRSQMLGLLRCWGAFGVSCLTPCSLTLLLTRPSLLSRLPPCSDVLGSARIRVYQTLGLDVSSAWGISIFFPLLLYTLLWWTPFSNNNKYKKI